MDDEDALDKCDFRRATELQVAIQRADVEVTGEAGQTRYFSCSIGEHCRDGQVLTVEWVANATAAPTATGATGADAGPEERRLRRRDTARLRRRPLHIARRRGGAPVSRLAAHGPDPSAGK